MAQRHQSHEPAVLCGGDDGPWQVVRCWDGIAMTEAPGRRGVTDQIRAPRNRDPREAETGPPVMPCPGCAELRSARAVNGPALCRPVGDLGL